MKKSLLVFTIYLISFGAFSQGLEIGLNGGFPIGETDEQYNSNFGADIGYIWGDRDGYGFYGGFTSGYRTFLPKTEQEQRVAFVPIAASLRVAGTGKISVEWDFGYGLAIRPDDIPGGFYMRPSLGYYISLNTIITLSYISHKSGENRFQSINIGIRVSLFE